MATRRRSRTVDEASAVLGQDLWQLLAEGPSEALAQTVNTQPVMLTAGVAVYRLWLDRGARLPSVLAGHSLGEYSALVAAGVIAFADAVPLVRLRAAAMQEAVPAGAGRWRPFSASMTTRLPKPVREAESDRWRRRGR
jgi:[acyl-carrier-protein] S-malonyltransferase